MRQGCEFTPSSRAVVEGVSVLAIGRGGPPPLEHALIDCVRQEVPAVAAIERIHHQKDLSIHRSRAPGVRLHLGIYGSSRPDSPSPKARASRVLISRPRTVNSAINTTSTRYPEDTNSSQVEASDMPRWDEKHKSLLRTARDVFSQYGFKKTTLDDIATRAGVAKSTCYYYFDSKEELFSDVIAFESRLLLEALKKAVQDSKTPEEQLIAFVKTRYRYIMDLRNLYSVANDIVQEMLPLARTEREKFKTEELAMLVAIVKEGVRRGDFRQCDADLLGMTIIASLSGLTETFFKHSEEDRIAKGMDGLLDLFLNGLKARFGDDPLSTKSGTNRRAQ